MSSDDLLREYIRDAMLSEKVAKIDPTRVIGGVVTRDVRTGASSGYWGRYGMGSQGSKTYQDVGRSIVGLVAPIFIMGVKTITDLGKGLQTFGSHLMSTVGSIFTGSPTNHANIAHRQAQFYQRSDSYVKGLISRWGTAGGQHGYAPATTTFFEVSSIIAEDSAATAQLAVLESTFLEGVEADLREFIAEMQKVRSANTVEEVVSYGAEGLKIEGSQYSTLSIASAEKENIMPSDVATTEAAVLPEMKRSILELGKLAMSQIKNDVKDIFASDPETYNPVFISQIETRYNHVDQELNSLMSGLT